MSEVNHLIDTHTGATLNDVRMTITDRSTGIRVSGEGDSKFLLRRKLFRELRDKVNNMKAEDIKGIIDKMLESTGGYAGQIENGKILMDGYFEIDDIISIADLLKQLDYDNDL